MNWDERYSIDDYLFGQKPAQALLRNEEYLVPCGETLLIADGEGRNSVYLAKNGFKVTSSDSSIVAQQKAKALADSQNVKVNFKLENFFDIDWSKKHNIFTVSLTAFDGGYLKQNTDLNIHVPTKIGEYGPAEDLHMVICGLVGSYFRAIFKDSND